MAQVRTSFTTPVPSPAPAGTPAAPQGAATGASATLAARFAAYQAVEQESGGSTSRESVAGVPIREDFGAALFHQFHNSPLSTWQRADLVEQVFNEWNSVGPSPQAAKRLQKVLAPGYIDTPEERQGAVILDAMALHLIDRGRYAPLVRDYIDALKRSGDHESLIDALVQDHPGRSREWASTMVETTLSIWDQPLPVELRGDDDPADQPAFDLDTRLLKLYRLMNADAHISKAADDRGETAATADTETSR